MVRFKHRYITVEVDPLKVPKYKPWELKSGKLYRAIAAEIEKLHGDFGIAATIGALAVRYCNKETKIGVIRCRHGPHRLVSSVLPFIRQIEKDAIQIRTLYTGATLHQCYKFIKGYQMEHLRKFYSNLSEVEKGNYTAYEESVMDVSALENMATKVPNKKL